MFRAPVARGPILLLLALIASAVGAAPAHADLSRKAATAKALSALGVEDRLTPEVVYADLTPAAAGSVVRVANTERPILGDMNYRSATEVTAPVLRRLERRTWVFYDDRAPGRGAARTAKVAFVDARSGRTSVSETISWPILVGGLLPQYFAAATSATGPTYQVFSRGVTGARAAAATEVPKQVGQLINGAERIDPVTNGTCVLGLGDAMVGSPFRGDGTARAFADFQRFTLAIETLRPIVNAQVYVPDFGEGKPLDWLQKQLRNCKDVLLWLSGAMYPQNAVLVLGLRAGGTKIVRYDMPLSVLRSVFRQRPNTNFAILMDVPGAERFEDYFAEANITLLRTSPSNAFGRRTAFAPYTLRATDALISGSRAPGDFGASLRTSKWCRPGLTVAASNALDWSTCNPAPAPTPAPTLAEPAAPVLLADQVDLSLGVGHSPAVPSKRNEITSVTLSVTNSGTGDARGVQVSTVLSREVDIVGFSGAAALSGTDRITWDVGDVPKGAVRVLRIDMRVRTPTPITVTSQVSASSGTDVDSTPGGGPETEDDYAVHTITPATAQLSVFAVDGTTQFALAPGEAIPIRVEQEAPVRLVALNQGKATATNVVLEFRAPSALSALRIDPSGAAGVLLPQTPPVARFTVPSVPPGMAGFADVTATAGVFLGPATATLEVVEQDTFDALSTPGNHLAGEPDQVDVPFNVVR